LRVAAVTDVYEPILASAAGVATLAADPAVAALLRDLLAPAAHAANGDAAADSDGAPPALAGPIDAGQLAAAASAAEVGALQCGEHRVRCMAAAASSHSRWRASEKPLGRRLWPPLGTLSELAASYSQITCTV
jgi:hypothetical protein